MNLRIVDSRNFVTGLLYAVFGAGVAIASLDYRLGTPRNMGAGFFPFAIALTLVGVGLLLIVGAVRRDAPRTDLGEWPLRPVFMVCLAVVLFGLLLRPAGLLIAVPVLIGVCALATGSYTWGKYLKTVAVLLPLNWAIFVWMLNLPISLLPSFLN